MRSLGVVMGSVMLGEHRQLVQVVPNVIKKMSNEWTPRGLALISAASLIVLFLLGNLRKYKPRTRIRITLWCAYLLQYAVTPAALVAITRTALDVCDTSQHHKLTTSELQSFWAPFLLLHLGGPDTITAYSLEDNELWLRHLVVLVSQSAAALYVLLLSWPGCSHLPQLSILVYLAGFIKCFERVQALRLANTEHLRDSMLGPADPGPNYHKFLEEVHLKKSQGFNVTVEEVPEPPLPANDHAYPGQGGVIRVAYDLFQTFKPLLVDLILTFEQREKSQSYLRNLPSVDAFSFVDIELGFAYDMIYTKASVAYTVMGLIRRATSVLAFLLVLVGFCFLNNMDNYGIIDIAITYLLIVVAMLMEIFAFIAMLRSDWTDRWLSQHNHTRSILIFPFLKQPTKLRWSNQIGQMDLLSVALQEKPATFLKIQKFFGVDKYREKHRYKTYSEVSDNLKDLIYTQFHEFMEECGSDPKALCTHKGSFSLQKNDCRSLLWSITEVEFDQSILIWHIATALCYYSEVDREDQANIAIHRMESKHISDYLLYLLVSYPVMLPMGIGMIRYRDTCAEAMRFFKDKGPITGRAEASKKLLKVDCTEVLPSKVKGDRCKSVLFDGCRLALYLRLMGRELMWKVINEVWIEILAYAATHCRGFEHRQQLRKGGEFLTHVWLLMAHLGITEQFQVSQGHARARICVS